ncbi:dihydroneopterin aldolase 1 isoform X1 [Capsicum annuum]|uniref:dihydroneopterin aldolase 1 isoform X1 n=2 Tax=Capsicum annuum TaxID=4072 RepID=UPI001FB0CF88|nr:dihydroneopterin aldolase 1 isoform X1 [Capsicum annuum]
MRVRRGENQKRRGERKEILARVILIDPIRSEAPFDRICEDSVTGHMDIPKGDKLVLRGLKFHGYHGVKQEEKKLGQKLLVDVDAWMDLRAAGESDCLSDTLNYTDIYRIVKEVMEGPPKDLLESVAQLIASTTLTKYPQVSAVRVQVGKPHVAVEGPVDYLGVEIVRYRNLDVQN